VDVRRAVKDNGVALLLTVILVLVVADYIRELLEAYPIGVDLEIPLLAAGRWVAGGDPYPASAFLTRTGGVDLPFLYPPFVLPFIAPLTFLPRALVFIVWSMILVGAAYASARRLGFGVIAAGVVLLWPPYLEALFGGNVQILLFTAYVCLMHHRDGRQLDPADRERPASIDGLLAAFVSALKVSQVHAWLYVLRRRPAAALIGLVPFALLALVTLPIVGIDAWFDWLSQAGRSGDPSWPFIGAPLSRLVGLPVALTLTVLSVLAVFVVPPRRASAWIGILALVGAPAVHMFTLLFLVPAMLIVRREIALVAAILVATFVASYIWIAIVIVAWSLIAMDRWPNVLARRSVQPEMAAPTSLPA
jgi:Glycosyltransferase family 87